jgi:hypothetical protein
MAITWTAFAAILCDELGHDIVSPLGRGDEQTPPAVLRRKNPGSAPEESPNRYPGRLEHLRQFRESFRAQRHERKNHERDRSVIVDL